MMIWEINIPPQGPPFLNLSSPNPFCQWDILFPALDPDATRITLTFDRFGQREFLLPISLEGGDPA